VLKEPYWQIDGDGLDSAAFFGALANRFPDATTLYVEGGSITPKVEACYLKHAEPGPFVPEPGTIRPLSKKLRCVFSKTLCDDLAELSKHAAEPELADHLHLFRGGEHILCWYDAFAHDLWLASQIPEQRIKLFASDFGRKYEMVKEHS
jgi:hypothetical protein